MIHKYINIIYKDRNYVHFEERRLSTKALIDFIGIKSKVYVNATLDVTLESHDYEENIHPDDMPRPQVDYDKSTNQGNGQGK